MGGLLRRDRRGGERLTPGGARGRSARGPIVGGDGGDRGRAGARHGLERHPARSPRAVVAKRGAREPAARRDPAARAPPPRRARPLPASRGAEHRARDRGAPRRRRGAPAAGRLARSDHGQSRGGPARLALGLRLTRSARALDADLPPARPGPPRGGRATGRKAPRVGRAHGERAFRPRSRAARAPLAARRLDVAAGGLGTRRRPCPDRQRAARGACSERPQVPTPSSARSSTRSSATSARSRTSRRDPSRAGASPTSIDRSSSTTDRASRPSPPLLWRLLEVLWDHGGEASKEELVREGWAQPDSSPAARRQPAARHHPQAAGPADGWPAPARILTRDEGYALGGAPVRVR